MAEDREEAALEAATEADLAEVASDMGRGDLADRFLAVGTTVRIIMEEAVLAV